MLFSEINPRIRYARYFNLDEKACYKEVVPVDARLFYVLNGHGKIQVKDKEYEMTPFSLLIINSGVPYRIMTPESSVCYIAINFDYTQAGTDYALPLSPVAIEKFKPEMLVDFHTFEDVSVLTEVLHIKKIDVIQKNLKRIIKEYSHKLLYHESKSGHLLAGCIVDSIRFFEIGNSDPEKEPSNRILSYIHMNYRENLTNISIGEKFQYHPNYVSYLIKHTTGMPVHQYIIHVRLMNAASLLENTALSVGEIAAACGFCDTAYFSRYFKKYFGISPSKYKNN